MKEWGDMMQQAREMSERLQRMQEQLGSITVSGSSGGGMVTVAATGKQEIVSVRIEKEVVSPDDVVMLQDLVCAAVNDALAKARELMASEMSKVTGGAFPGGM